VIFLGIDGGGSKTTFLLEDNEGHELARFDTGPSNWISVGPDRARESISQGILSLPSIPDIVCGGFAGAGRPEGVEFYHKCLASLLPHARLFVEIDAHIAYMGAIGSKPGVLLIAGTGSIAIARKSGGTMIRAGGWGPTFGDEGSGFWIGRAAVRTALRAHDTGEFPIFVSEIAQGLGLSRITDAPGAWKDGVLTVTSVASLAPRIISQFPSEPADQILTEAATELRNVAEAARRRAELPQTCVRAVSGSVAAQPVMQRLIGLPFSAAEHPPARGAILWARDRISNP